MILLTMEYKKGFKLCNECVHLIPAHNKDTGTAKCKIYPAMINMQRCISYIQK